MAKSASAMRSYRAKKRQLADELDKATNEYKKALNNKETLKSKLWSIRDNQYRMYFEQIKRTEDGLSEDEQKKLAMEMADKFAIQTRVHDQYMMESQRIPKLYRNMIELQSKNGYAYQSPLLNIEI